MVSETVSYASAKRIQLASIEINPKRPGILIQILQTDLHTFP